MGTISSLYNPCPDCSCGRQRFFDEDPSGENYKALKLVRQNLDRILTLIPLIENPQNFLKVRQELIDDYGVEILVWQDRTLQIKNTPALCKRTRKKLQEALAGMDSGIMQNLLNLDAEKNDQN